MKLSAENQAQVDELNRQMATVGQRAVGEMLETVPLPWSREVIADKSDNLVDNLSDGFSNTWETLDDDLQEVVLELINSARVAFIRRSVAVTMAFERAAGGAA